MADRKYYVVCDLGCKFESMTKEQILTAITQAVETGSVGNCDVGFITTIKTVNGQPLRFFVGEQSEYEALADKSNLFALITNDTTKEGLLASIAELQTNYTELGKGLREGAFVVGKSEQAAVYPFKKITSGMSNSLNDETYCVTGRWYFHHRETTADNFWQNMPTGCTNGWLETFQSPTTASICDQMFHRSGSTSNFYEVYTRTRFSSGEWSEWRRLVTKEELDNGNIVVAKAEQDGKGNIIADTYAPMNRLVGVDTQLHSPLVVDYAKTANIADNLRAERTTFATPIDALTAKNTMVGNPTHIDNGLIIFKFHDGYDYYRAVGEISSETSPRNRLFVKTASQEVWFVYDVTNSLLWLTYLTGGSGTLNLVEVTFIPFSI